MSIGRKVITRVDLEWSNRGIEIDPNRAYGWSNRGSALVDLGKYDEALQSYDRDLQIDPTYVEAWANKGQAFICQVNKMKLFKVMIDLYR